MIGVRRLTKKSSEYKELTKEFYQRSIRVEDLKREILNLDVWAEKLGNLQKTYDAEILKAKQELKKIGIET